MAKHVNISRALAQRVLGLHRGDRFNLCPGGFAPFTIPYNTPTTGKGFPAVSWYTHNGVWHRGSVWVVLSERYGLSTCGIYIRDYPLWLHRR